jgi:hypothetical protein
MALVPAWSVKNRLGSKFFIEDKRSSLLCRISGHKKSTKRGQSPNENYIKIITYKCWFCQFENFAFFKIKIELGEYKNILFEQLRISYSTYIIVSISD